MSDENRVSTRYKEIGRILIPDVSSFPGVLDDISISGCKIHFLMPVVIDLENEYNVKILLSRNSTENPLNLYCKPQWAKECQGATQIGMKIIFSPDMKRLESFIEDLRNENTDIFPDII